MKVYAMKVSGKYIARKHDGDYVQRKVINENCLYTVESEVIRDKKYLENIKQYKGEITIVDGELTI